MTEDDLMALEVLTAIEVSEPVTSAELELEVRRRLTFHGLPEGKASSVVTEALRRWSKCRPPLVLGRFSPEGVDNLGRARPGARIVWHLTDAGEQELARLIRLAEQ